MTSSLVAGLNALDWFLLIVLLGSTILGLFRGLIREVFAMASWIIAFAVAKWFGMSLAQLLEHLLANDTIRIMAGYLGVFVLTWIVITLMGLAAHTLVAMTGLGFFNRLAGGLFGAARGTLLCVLLVLLGGMTALPANPLWKNSRAVGWALEASHWVLPLFPVEVLKRLH